MKKLAAEFVGTLVLVFFGVGSVVIGIDLLGVVGVALTFGLVLLALVYALGPVSGANVNPAVTLGLLLAGRLGPAEAAGYWAAQLLGGVAGAGLLKLLLVVGGVTDQTANFGSNGWGVTVNGGGAFLIEVVMTALLVLVVLLVTGRASAPGFAGLVIGLTLAVVHLIGIPLTGTSVNPARSLGPAVFAGGEALRQLWLFIVAPLVGAVVAALLWLLVRDPLDATRLAGAAAEDEVPAAMAGDEHVPHHRAHAGDGYPDARAAEASPPAEGAPQAPAGAESAWRPQPPGAAGRAPSPESAERAPSSPRANPGGSGPVR